MAIFNSYVSLPEGTSGAYLSNLVLFRVWSPGGKSQNIRTFFSINHGSVGWSTSMWNLKNLNDFNKPSTCIYTFFEMTSNHHEILMKRPISRHFLRAPKGRQNVPLSAWAKRLRLSSLASLETYAIPTHPRWCDDCKRRRRCPAT
jgi:hypothetical protein